MMQIAVDARHDLNRRASVMFCRGLLQSHEPLASVHRAFRVKLLEEFLQFVPTGATVAHEPPAVSDLIVAHTVVGS